MCHDHSNYDQVFQATPKISEPARELAIETYDRGVISGSELRAIIAKAYGVHLDLDHKLKFN